MTRTTDGSKQFPTTRRDTMKAFLTSIAPQALDILAPVLVAALGWLSFRLSAYIRAHTQNARVQGVLLRLNDAATTAVESVEQTIVASLQASARSGKLDKYAAEEAKRAAVLQVEATLGGQKGLAEAMQILGITSLDDLKNLIGSKIEARVLKLPETAPTNTAAVVPLAPMSVPGPANSAGAILPAFADAPPPADTSIRPPTTK